MNKFIGRSFTGACVETLVSALFYCAELVAPSRERVLKHFAHSLKH